MDFDYYLDSATTLNFWLWTTASHDSSATDSRYASFGLTWRLGRTEMESQQSHGKKEPRKKGK